MQKLNLVRQIRTDNRRVLISHVHQIKRTFQTIVVQNYDFPIIFFNKCSQKTKYLLN